MGHTKDFHTRIRGGGDDAIAALEELLNTRDSVLKGITDVFAGPRWIPVTERLPERDWDGFSAIVVVAAGNRPRCGPYLLGRYYKCEPGNECHECDADIGERWYIDTTMPVTHWMPLPAPPAD